MLSGPWTPGDLFRGAGRNTSFVSGIDRLAAVAAGTTPPAILAHGLEPKINPNCASVHAALDTAFAGLASGGPVRHLTRRLAA